MYRITNSMLKDNYLRNIQTNLSNMGTLQDQLSSGKKISNGAQDPNTAAKIMNLNSQIASNKQYSTNIKDVGHLLDTTDTALSETSKVLSRIRELLVKAGNGTFKEDEQSAVKDEVVSCVRELGDDLNNTYSGKYVFGGSKTTSKAVTVDSSGNMSYCDEDGNAVKPNTDGSETINLATKNNITEGTKVISGIKKEAAGTVTITYTDAGVSKTVSAVSTSSADIHTALISVGAGFTDAGNAISAQVNSAISKADISVKQIGTDLRTDISDGVSINYNKSASDLLEFKDSKGASVNAMSVFSSIISNLGIASDKSKSDADQSAAKTALGTSDLEDLDKVIENFTTARSEIGTLQNRIDSAADVNDDQSYNLTSSLSQVEDIDMAEANVSYASAQTVYKSTLQVSSQILNTTLLDYL